MTSAKMNLSVVLLLLAFSILSSSCSRNQTGAGSNTAKVEIRLTDSPFPQVKGVWVDVQQVEIVMGDSSKPILLSATHPGVYNLLDFTNGKDTLLTDANLPSGTISQLRLILGSNNYIVTNDGTQIPLKTPSAQQSGLKVQVHQDVVGGILYRLVLDFDAGRSIVQAGNSGNYILKPVLRIVSLQSSGGDIKGIIVPDSVRTAIFAIQGLDTIASAFNDTSNGNFLIKDVPAGAYSLTVVPLDTAHFQSSIINTTVVLGQVTNLDSVYLKKK
ncbi:MAG: DUF4382 domain-containing protein [Bacteroidetes bacterium]|nr:DUF4382 domain-containing protein [Bacteroidota bacterium]